MYVSYSNKKPLAIDLYAGLGGWAEGFLAEGYDVVGFDIERHRYPEMKAERDNKGFGGTWFHNAELGTTNPNRSRDGGGIPTGRLAEYPGQLVLQDVMTIHGSQFKDATCIVASPPCQAYSYLAMPWSRSPDVVRPCGDGWEILNSAAAKEMRAEWEHEGPDNRLFDACFRIQREACEVADRYIPLIVENVRGAIPWVGRSAWNYGSFHLWGDVPALMPITLKHKKVPGFRFDGSGRSFQTASVEATEKGAWDNTVPGRLRRDDSLNFGGVKVPGQIHGTEYALTRAGAGGQTTLSTRDGEKTHGHVNKRDGHSHTRHLTNQAESDAVKQCAGNGDWFSKEARDGGASARYGSKSNARKQASAQIAKIPFELARHIAATYKRPKLLV
jgi:hypothetical protein